MHRIESHLLWILALLMTALPCVAQTRTTVPNVLLLSVDTLRSDHVSGYGYQRKTTPSLDMLMNQGIRFEDAHCIEPLTAPSFSSVMMSRYPHETGLTRNGLRVQVKFPTIAELLKKAGYSTGAVQSNWTIRAEISGMDRGFDFYDDDFHRLRSPVVTERDAKFVTQFALEWLDQQKKSKPFFLWAHYSDPHAPYVYRSDSRLPLLQGEVFLSPRYRYDTEVAHADKYIGKLIDGLRRRGLLENMLIFFIADHGESLGERDYYGHGRQLYESSIKVPMAITGPGIRQGLTSKAPAQLMDVMPTILSILGLTLPTGIRGESLIETDGTPRQIARGEIYFETYRGAVPDVPGADKMMPGVKPLLLGVKQGKWKCIFSAEKQKAELYNMETDPGETRDLNKTYPDIAKEMTKKVLSWHQSTNPHIPAQRTVISEENMKKLKALGYIQ